MGPAGARHPAAAHAAPSLANEAFPYLRARELAVGHVPVLAARVTYVGELGWELYPPAEYALALWDALWAAGAEHGLTRLRLPRHRRPAAGEGLPRLGQRPLAGDDARRGAALGFAVRLDKPGAFVGRDALAERRARRAAGRPAWPACLLDDARAVALGSEPVRTPGGEPVGRVTSGGYGYTVERSIALRPPARGPDAGRHAAGGRHLRPLGRRRGRG